MWALTSAYDAKEEVVGVLDQLLQTRQLYPEQRDRVRAALENYKRSKAGFVDCLLGRLNRGAGCEETVTCDQSAAMMEGWRELEG